MLAAVRLMITAGRLTLTASGLTLTAAKLMLTAARPVLETCPLTRAASSASRVNEKHAGRAAHTGARAELEAVAAEVMRLVGQLDTLNQFRFRNDAESLGAWRSARNVAWPLPQRDASAPSDGKVQPAA
jgi:hypothetical protein